MRCAPVLIVSSDVHTQDVYVLHLRRLRVPAIGATTIDEAVVLLRESRVAAVLYDVVTAADWGGCALICSELPAPPKVIVLTSCVSTGAWRDKARQIGSAGFLVKPCSPDIVLDAVTRVANGERWIEYTGGV
jgi:DNA-binding NarL/FixJ family response regulator